MISICSLFSSSATEGQRGVHMAEKSKTTVRISGKEYTLVGEESPEYIQRVASLLDEKMAEVERSSMPLSTSMTAILAGLNLADDLCKAQDENQALNGQIALLKSELRTVKDR